MRNFKIKLQLPDSIHSEIKYIWDLFSKHTGFEYEWVDNNEDIIIGLQESHHICISDDFIKMIETKSYSWQSYFKNDPAFYCSNGKADLLGTCFYMINSLQEYNPTELDHFGRYLYAESYQNHFSCTQRDLVSEYFKQLHASIPALHNVSVRNFQSRIFLSHDIDRIYGSFLEDGYAAFKKLRLDVITGLMFNALMGKPEWLKMDKIMKIESEYDVRSTFFWMVNHGQTRQNLRNADYRITSRSVNKEINSINNKGFFIGLHKSVSGDSYDQELEKLPVSTIINRNHFLKMNIPNTYLEIDKSGIKIDTSLGFPEMYGFRNSYSLPFNPYILNTKQTSKFIEVPMNIMDYTFWKYMNYPAEKSLQTIIDFMDSFRNNTVISILFHNNYLTGFKFREYLLVYKGILAYIKKQQISCLTPNDILVEFGVKDGVRT